MIRLIGSELFKLRTTRMYLWLLVGAVSLVVFATSIHFLLGDDSSLSIEGANNVVETEADLRSVLDVSGIASLFTSILGATAVAGEHRHRTITSTFLLTPSRGRVVAAKLVGYTIAGAVFGIIVELAALLVAMAWLTVGGSGVPFGASVAVGLALNPVATGLAAGFGVGIGAAVPNQLGAVLAAVGWVMVIEQLLAGLVPDLAQWLPFTGAGIAITGSHPTLGVAGGLGVFLAYMAVLSAIGVVVTKRRDVA